MQDIDNCLRIPTVSIIIFDDYGAEEGVRLAVQQFTSAGRLRPVLPSVQHKAVSCLDGEPQSLAAAMIMSRMLRTGDSVWVYRAVKAAVQDAATPEEANAKFLAEQEAAQTSVDSVTEVFRQAGMEQNALHTQVQSVMSPGAAVTSFVGKSNANFVSLGSHGPGRVLHKSLASYLMQSYSDIRLLVCPLTDWQPAQDSGLKYTVVYDGCSTSRHALEVLAGHTNSQDTVEILHAHVPPAPVSRGKFRGAPASTGQEDAKQAQMQAQSLFQEAEQILSGSGGGIKEVIGTHIEVQSGHLLGERLLDTAINNGCDVLVAGTKCMPGIGNLFEPFLKGRTVLGVLKSSLTTHLLNNAVDIPVLYIN
ncbi:tas [Symbiodinium pilosum]|uniref:Tas protein n=1 Tax=Symbiodinium pilosum TaxID=2952 RepID=A0A812V088_SYMPI|nr:tas [Symbiodinium pilosum]